VVEFKVSNRGVLQCFATFDLVNGNSFEITYVWILQTPFTIDQLRNDINTAVIWNILEMMLENAFTSSFSAILDEYTTRKSSREMSFY